jgi:hypothetical protein
MQVFSECARRIEYVAVQGDFNGRVIRGEAHFDAEQPNYEKWKISLVSHACFLSNAGLRISAASV